ncbi:hypothetical protein WJX81_000463 [Elliptochloris bilobata]|uniref:Uncharacterized protein n=1 Tax=Elliptochloris bilobata TaxID=381761 RepID=A0AAW1SGW5_9CHLO
MANGDEPLETLADVSRHGVGSLLKRAGMRSGRGKGRSSHSSMMAAAQACGLPAAAADAPAGTCGAPAQNTRDRPAAAARDAHEDVAVTAEAAAAALGACSEDEAGFSEDKEEGAPVSHGMDWEDAAAEASGSDPESWENAAAAGSPEERCDIEVDVGTPEPGGSGEGVSKAERRKKARADKQDLAMRKLVAEQVHRANLLGLLAHGLLLDRAADDTMLQALVLSMADPAALPEVHTERGCAKEALPALLAWFNGAMRQLRPEETLDMDLEDLPAGGLPGAVERLRGAAAARAGTGEELVLLFVALLRALGLQARSVRGLDVVPLKPSRKAPARRPHKPKAVRHKPAAARGSGPLVHASSGGGGSGKGGNGGKGSGGKREKPDAGDAGEADAGAAQQRKPRARKQAAAGTGEEAASPGTAKRFRIAEGGRSVGAPGGPPRNRGEHEFENQMLMAYQASLSAYQARKGVATDFSGDVAPERAHQLPSAVEHDGVLVQHRVRQTAAAKLGRLEDIAPAGAAWARGGSQRSLGADVWAEVFCGAPDSGAWVHVDPLLGWLDMPERVAGTVARASALAYCAAFSNGGAKDVTLRYVPDLRAVEKLRDAQWWTATLAPLRGTATTAAAGASAHGAAHGLSTPHAQGGADGRRAPPGSGGNGGGGGTAGGGSGGGSGQGRGRDAAQLVAAREDEELRERRQAQDNDIPNTLPMFKAHPRYVLQRHLGTYQALREGAVSVGLHKGETFWLRADVVELHTAEQWLTAGRQVKAAQADKPYKEVARRGAKAAEANAAAKAAEADNEGEDGDLFKLRGAASLRARLYGEWQTEAWVPPRAVGGIVPKDARGSVKVPPMSAGLPTGTVHLAGYPPRVKTLCCKLGVDFAEALVGFERRGGATIPTMDGVVVCAEHAAAVRKAFAAEEQEKAAKAEAKWRAAAEADWRKLLSTVLARLRVEAAHGALPDPTNSPGSAKRPITLGSGDKDRGVGAHVGGAPLVRAPGARGAVVKAEEI